MGSLRSIAASFCRRGAALYLQPDRSISIPGDRRGRWAHRIRLPIDRTGELPGAARVGSRIRVLGPPLTAI